MTHVTCRLTAKNRDQLRNPTPGSLVWATFFTWSVAVPAMPGAKGPKTLKGAQSDRNYVSRLLLDCVPVFHKIITPAYLLYRS